MLYSGKSTDKTDVRDEKARAKEAAKLMSDAVARGVSDFKTLPKELKKAIDKSGNALAKKLADGTKDIQGVLKIEDQIAAMRQISAGLKDIKKGKFESNEEIMQEFGRLSKLAKNAGTSLTELGLKGEKVKDEFGNIVPTLKNANESIEQLDETTEVLSDSMDEAQQSTRKFTTSTAKASKALGVFWSILKETSKLALDEIKISDQRAVADMGVIKGLKLMNLHQVAYGKFLAETRQEQLAMASAGVDFTSTLEENSRRLRDITADPEEAAEVQALFIKNAARMGVSQEELGNAVGDQITMYEKNGRAFGQSALEAAKLTEALMADSEIQLQIVRLRGKERREFVLGLAARQAELKSMGYTQERAEGVQKALAALEGMNPRERMKASAKKRAMLGALGMGAEGARLMELELRVQYEGDAAKKKAMQGEITRINARASNKFLEKTGAGQSIGQGMMWAQLAEKTGFKNIAQTFETTSGEGLKINKDQLLEVKNTNKHLTEIKNTANLLAQMEKSAATTGGVTVGKMAVGALATGAGLVVMKKLMGAGSKIMGSASGAGGSVLNAAKGAGGSVLNAAKGAGGTALNAAKGAGRLAMGPAGAVLAAGAAGYAAGTLINDQLSEETKIGIGDFIGKGIDNVLSFFGSDEAESRLNAMSKSASENQKKVAEKQIKEDQEISDSMTKEKEKKSINLEKLNQTLESLQTYLKEINGQNSEQAKSISALAINMNDQARVNNFN